MTGEQAGPPGSGVNRPFRGDTGAGRHQACRLHRLPVRGIGRRQDVALNEGGGPARMAEHRGVDAERVRRRDRDAVRRMKMNAGANADDVTLDQTYPLRDVALCGRVTRQIMDLPQNAVGTAMAMGRTIESQTVNLAKTGVRRAVRMRRPRGADIRCAACALRRPHANESAGVDLVVVFGGDPIGGQRLSGNPQLAEHGIPITQEFQRAPRIVSRCFGI